jgi:hypothetical protein
LHRLFDGSWAMMSDVRGDSRRGESEAVRVMGSSEERAERIEALRGLLDRLCAPDLTLAEAKPLRSRLFDLLERIDRGMEPVGATPPQRLAPSSDRNEGPSF